MMLELGGTSERKMSPRKDSRAYILLVNCLTFGLVLLSYTKLHLIAWLGL